MLIGVDLNRMQYVWIKGQLQQIDFSAYSFDFIRLEGVTNGEFKIGDKIVAVIEGTITGSNPGKAQVKEIKMLDISDTR